MAEVITRFKLETTQYDSKLRDAAKSLADVTKQASMAGNEFGKFTQKNVEAARVFGNIATSATNGKDKVKELVSAFNDVARSYNVLTKEQQQSDFGKALAQSMQTLKGRISEAKAEMNSTGGILGQLKDKFTINIDALKLFNVGLSASKAALDVAKDAFFASEATVDEWGRIVASSESLYQGFLNALNTGDISGYLNRMDEIVQAARAAYDELDRLGTMKTIQAPEIARQEAENNRMRTMLMTGRYIAPTNGPAAPGMKTGDLLSPEQIRNIERHLQGGMQKIVSLTQREVKQTGVAIEKYYDSLAKQNGMTMDEFRKGTSNWAEFSKRMNDYQKYLDFEQKHTSSVTMQSSAGAYTQQVRDSVANPYEYARKWGVFRVDKMGQNSYNDLVNLIKQQQQQASQMYSTMGQTYRTINRAEGITVKGILGGGGGSAGGGIGISTTTEMQANQKRINELTQEYVNLSSNATVDAEERLTAIRAEISELNKRNGTLKLYEEQAHGRFVGPEAQTSGLGSLSDISKGETITISPDQINELGVIIDSAMAKMPKRMDDTKLSEKVSKFNGDFSKVSGGISSIVGGIQQMGIDIPNEIQSVLAMLSGMSSIMTGITALLTMIEVDTKATAAATTFDAAVPFARGGIVKAAGGVVAGRTYSMDQVPALLNAGEVVLNRAQTNAVASQPTDGGGGGSTKVVGVLKGEDIVLMADRYGRRRGLGELVFGKNL